MIGDNIKRARLANCMSLQQLADRMKENGVTLTKTTIFNYESGAMRPPDGILEVFAQVLGVNISYFFHELPSDFRIELIEELGSVDARRQELISYIQIQLMQLTRVCECIGFDLCKRSVPGAPIRVNTLEEVEDASEFLRTTMQLGSNPISSVSALLEDHGYFLFALPDVFQWKIISGHEISSNARFIFASQSFFVDDFRHILLREFGKNVLIYPKDKEETFLNRFASSMLMPRKSLVIEFGSVRSSIGYDEMRLAKQKYGLSRTLMLYRLAEVGILSEQNAFLIRQKMVQNYHISRTSMSYLPLSFYEKPSVLYMLTHRAISEGYLKSEADLDFISSISLY